MTSYVITIEADRQPRPQGFSLKKWVGRRPTHFLREKPWGRGWLTVTELDSKYARLMNEQLRCFIL